MEDILVATAIVNAPLGQLTRNLKRTQDLAAKAAAKGASLICFPEMNLTGYATRGELTQESAACAREVTEQLQETADTHHITILAGLAERAPEGALYASHLVISPHTPPGIYRKTHLAPPETEDFSAGSDLPLFEVNGFTFGIQLCYDAHFPHLATIMAEAGADALFLPHASPRGTSKTKFKSWMRHLPARAYDNSLFVIACNQTGENGAGLDFPGLALFLDPSGNILTQCTTSKETLLFCNLKREALEKVRTHRMRYFLPNRRKDIQL